MTRSVALAALFLVLSMLMPPALAFAGQQRAHESARPHEPARSPESGGHHPAARPQPDAAARPQPHAPTTAPTMPGLSSAQVLSGPLPMFPAPPASPFRAAPSTYLRHKKVSPFLRPRPSIVIGGFAVGGDAPSETPPPAGRADTPTIETPVVAQPPEAQPPDRQPPRAQAPDAAPSAAPAALAPVTLYVIPGCYAGDRPPVDGILPAGCDVAKMRTVRIR
jgi:hypothetical protein